MHNDPIRERTKPKDPNKTRAVMRDQDRAHATAGRLAARANRGLKEPDLGLAVARAMDAVTAEDVKKLTDRRRARNRRKHAAGRAR